MSSAPTLSVVVSTIGRPAALRRLLESLEGSTARDALELVVVDQSEDRVSSAIAHEPQWSFPRIVETSGRGASVGRNVGLKLASGRYVAFPDDDAWYPEDTLDAAIRALDSRPDAGGLCGRQVTADGRASMLRWLRSPTLVSRGNFLRTSIMSTMFFRREALDRAGWFDESMGVGTGSWYGACEESDLLLRVVEAGEPVPYDPELLVHQDEPRDDPDERFVAKMLSYGCGQGHLWREHHLSRPQLGWLLARKLGAATVRTLRGDHILARADIAWLRGNIAGLRDRPPRNLRYRAR